MTKRGPLVESAASPNRPKNVRGFLAVIQIGAREPRGASSSESQALRPPGDRHVSRDRRMQIRVVPRSLESFDAEGEPASAPTALVLGADSEWSTTGDGEMCMGAGVTIRYDLDRTRLTIRTSVVGLPPVFLYQTPSMVAVASDLFLLKSVPGIRFDFDPQGVTELCRVGHPIGFRTLFAGVRIVPGGSELDVNAQGDAKVTAAWTMPDGVPLNSWHSYTALQIELFNDALRRVGRDGSFLSLTAGLDTRTILAALLSTGEAVPACTMSWKDLTLDARTAGALCRSYGIEHRVVGFDEAFAEKLPDYALRASCLSGGLASVWEATEVAFYDRIGSKYRTRVSGYLGNQIGRGGVEQVRPRNGDPSFLGAALAWDGTRPRGDHRANEAGRASRPDRLRLMLQEVLFASIGNYGIGNHFVVQESPYACRSLIEALPQAPKLRGALSVPRMRLRDLMYRFIGEVEERSFQRKLVKAVGGYVAECPVNWGWRVSGGIAANGLGLGILALLDMAAASRSLEGNVIGRALAALPTTGLYDFRQPRKWCSREFVQDTLRARELRESSVFAMATIDRMLREHFAGERDHFRSLMLALDVAHAYRVFIGSRSEDVARFLTKSTASTAGRSGEPIERVADRARGVSRI